MPAALHHNQSLEKNAELQARLKVSEETIRQVKQAHERLKQVHEQLQSEHRQALERKGMLEEEVLKLRQEKSTPILTTFKQWVDDLLPGTPPRSALGKALAYTTNQWPKLVRQLEHGEVPIHNSDTENRIRPFAQGRRVRLFCHNPSVRAPAPISSPWSRPPATTASNPTRT